MVSLRKIAECLGFSGSFSVVFNFLGYRTQFSGRNISLLRHLKLLQNRYFNLNIIRVGTDNFNDDDHRKIDFAIQATRNIYAAVNLGIGRIGRHGITVAATNGRDVITDDAEARALTNEWTIPNASLDVFIVLNGWAGTSSPTSIRAGLSAVNGLCDKNANCVMTGSVIAIRSDPTGTTLAHELGHYLGLPHVCEFTPGKGCLSGTCKSIHQSSLMFPCTGTTSVGISSDEFLNINDHCFVNAGCAG